MSIDTGGASPDLVLGLKVLSLDQFPNISVQVEVKPAPGRTVSDATVRIVLLMDAESPLLDSGPIEDSAQFAAFQFRVAPPVDFPNLLQVGVTTPNLNIDSEATTIDSPGLSLPFPPGKITVNRVSIDIRDDRGLSGPGVPLDIAGGIVSGPMVSLAGVETDRHPLTGVYQEFARSIRGIDLDWAEGTGPLPPSGTWLDARVEGSPASPSRFSAEVDLPVTQDAPEGKPAVAAAAGGALRSGSYRYCSTWAHENGCESSPSERSDPVTLGGGTRTVRVSGLPAPPAAPSPDPTGLRVTARRLYRTDTDASSSTTDPDRGDSGDDILVVELPVDETDFDDTGPADPTLAPQLRTDYLSVRYFAPASLDITGGIRLVDGGSGTDESYRGSVGGAPTELRVVHKPGRDPRVLWVADAATAELSVAMPAMVTDFGAGLEAKVTDLPEEFALDWSILGSEFLGLATAGDLSAAAPGGTDAAAGIGQVGVVLGSPARPAAWPEGEHDVAVELRDASAGTPFSLFSMSGLRRGSVRSGARRWSDRDADAGVIEVDSLFAATEAAADRDLRFARSAGGDDAFPQISVDGHFLPDRVHAWTRIAEGADTEVTLDSRVRFLRAAFRAASGEGRELDGIVFLDDTTDLLEASLGTPPRVTAGWPVRVAGTVRLREAPGATPTLSVWPDVIVPQEVEVRADWPMGAELSEPGVSGRVVVGFGDEAPLAVRATPQVKVSANGGAEANPGLAAIGARVLSVAGAQVPESVTRFGEAGEGSGVVDVTPTLKFHPRSNTALRVEAIERDGRIAHEPDLRAPEGARSWLRARTTHLPPSLTPLVRLEDGSPLGGELVAPEAWGEGVLWAEPSFTWEPPEGAAAGAVTDLGADQGIGNITLGWDSIPTRVEGWLLSNGPGLDGKVPDGDRLPGVGPSTAGWVAGGAVLRVDGPLQLSGVRVALYTGASRVCWFDTTSGGFGTGVILEPDRPVRHGNWIEAAAPFVDMVPATAGIKDVVLWYAASSSATEPPSGTPEPNPCVSDGSDSDGPDTAVGWRIHDDMRMRMALKYYDLVTPSGPLDPAPRWWSMPTSSEGWNGDEVDTGEWELRYELQMDEFGSSTIAVFPNLTANIFDDPDVLDNPFGDWEGGTGTYWARARSIGAGPFSLDVYMGNVGGGTSIPFSDGLFSSLPRIFGWSYP